MKIYEAFQSEKLNHQDIDSMCFNATMQLKLSFVSLSIGALLMLSFVGIMTATVKISVYAQQDEKPEQLPSQSSRVAECSATMTHQSLSAPHVNHADGPAKAASLCVNSW